MPINTYRHVVGSVLLISFLILIAGCSGGPNAKLTPPQDLVGTWVGSGQHSLNEEYLAQKDIPFEIRVTSDGSITGTVGDADIDRTYLKPVPFYVKILGKEKFKASFDLEGNIVNQENFARKSGTIVFKKIGPTEVICSFKSSGSDVKADNLILPISEISLSHSSKEDL